MARRIPNSQFIGLTGGHFLFGHAIGDSGRNRRVHRKAFEQVEADPVAATALVGGFLLQPNAVEAHTGFEPVLPP